MRGNLLDEPVDAIVNAANGHLAHGGGVAGVISRAAGPELQHECDLLVQKHGPFATGAAVVSTAGKLPFKGVIHAVGPRQGEGEEEAKLFRAVMAAFGLARDRQWQSVSFPAVSSGIFAVPLDVCARAYLKAMRASPLSQVRLCLRDQPVIDAVLKELETLIFVLGLVLALPALAQKAEKASFAGGCFWCTEEAFEKVPGVISAVSGYMGGSVKNPSYDQVSTGRTGHTEVVEVTFDPARVSYEKLLDVFWVNHDPTVKDRQFCDSGSQYRPEIFYYSEEQKKLAEASKAKWEKQKPFRQPILTPITKASAFYPAEDYHQDYYKKNALQYKFYVTGCGRYARLDSLWGSLRK